MKLFSHMKTSTKALLMVLLVVILAGAGLLIWGIKTGKIKSSADVAVPTASLSGQAYFTNNDGTPIMVNGQRVGPISRNIMLNDSNGKSYNAVTSSGQGIFPPAGSFQFLPNTISVPQYVSFILTGDCDRYQNLFTQYYCPPLGGLTFQYDHTNPWVKDLPYYKAQALSGTIVSKNNNNISPVPRLKLSLKGNNVLPRPGYDYYYDYHLVDNLGFFSQGLSTGSDGTFKFNQIPPSPVAGDYDLAITSTLPYRISIGCVDKKLITLLDQPTVSAVVVGSGKSSFIAIPTVGGLASGQWGKLGDINLTKVECP